MKIEGKSVEEVLEYALSEGKNVILVHPDRESAMYFENHVAYFTDPTGEQFTVAEIVAGLESANMTPKCMCIARDDDQPVGICLALKGAFDKIMLEIMLENSLQNVN